MIAAVVFDIGETLVDETEVFGRWADWIGVPRHTFSAVLGAILQAGGGHRDVFTRFRPGFDIEAEEALRVAAGLPNGFDEDDLYPDARLCLTALRDLGVWVGIAGNQPSRAGDDMRQIGLPAEMIGISDDWGVAKPDPAFFARVIDAAPCDAGQIVYVGDRVDNDIRPARAAGMRTAFIRRGPWGYIQEGAPDLADVADWRLESLAELPDLVAAVRRGIA